MSTNTLEQPLFDYRVLESDDRSFLKERALRIRETAKRTAEGIILIGQWLTESKARLKHGQWLSWLESEFGWSVRSAQNFMGVYESVKNANVAHLNLDISALYLIAAPKTPEPVRQEVIRRAEAGEPMTRAKAVEVLDSYVARAAVPTPAVARQIAIATGKPTATTQNIFALPMSKVDEEVLSQEQNRIRNIYNAIEVIAKAQIAPDVMVALGRKHACRFLGSWSETAGQWLLEVAQEAK